MWLWLAVWLLLGGVAAAQGPKTLTLQSAATTGNGTDMNIVGYSVVSVVVSGVAAGANRVVTFNVSLDGTLFATVLCRNVSDGTQATSQTASGTTVYQWTCPVPGMQQFRAVVSGGTTGAVNVTASALPQVSSVPLLPSSGTGSGTVTSIATTSPITGGTITSTGTIACATCAVTSGTLGQFAATTSAALAGVLSDETGTGAAVFAGSPTFTGTITGVDLSLTGNVALANNLAYQQKDSGGTARSLLSLASSNILFVGSAATSDMAFFAGGAVRAFPGGNEHLHMATNALLRYGANGPTNPALYVDASVASAATGLLISAKAVGNALRLDTISTGTDEAVIIASKGAGSVVLSSSAANSLVVDSGNNVTVLGLATTGAATGKTIVCADTNGKLYRSSSGVACAN